MPPRYRTSFMSSSGFSSTTPKSASKATAAAKAGKVVAPTESSSRTKGRPSRTLPTSNSAAA